MACKNGRQYKQRDGNFKEKSKRNAKDKKQTNKNTVIEVNASDELISTLGIAEERIAEL